MTLDEVIDSFENDLKYSDNVRDNFALMYLRELKSLRVELEKNSKELEIYKKALKIACEEIDIVCQSNETAEQCKNCVFNCRHADLVESYLMKTREEDNA